MRAYIIRRLLLLIPTLFILTILVFLSVRFIPGDAIDVLVSQMEFESGTMDREALRHMLGLDVPVYVQYGRWIGGISRARHPWRITVGRLVGRGEDSI